MRIINANIVLENKIIKGYIESNNGKITKIGSGKCSKTGYDANGLYLLPAFVDSHTHGGYGLDFNMLSKSVDAHKVHNYLTKVQAEGVGSIMMTTVTASDKDLNEIAHNYKTLKTLDKSNVIKGWYIEGPYLSADRKGAHDSTLIRSLDLKELKNISSITKDVTKILAVAPENKNNIKLISKISEEYFIAVGHSAADYTTAMNAFNLGAKRIVHLYNAMPDFDKRHPTILNAIFNRNDLYCELICDKGHVSPEVILNTYKILGANQILIISDSLLTKGLKDGKYNVWGTHLEKRGVLDYLPGTNNIAGGNLPFNIQVENFGNITKCSMNDILKVSSLNAAKSIKQEKHFGNLVIGASDNVVLLNKRYQLRKIFINNN